MTTELQLIEIETKIAYQEKLMEELNSVVYQQQLKIDELEKIISEVRKKIADDINTAHIAPPHY